MKQYIVTIISVATISWSAFGQFQEPKIINQDNRTYTASFVAHWGSDTASIETFTITGNIMFGQAIHLYPEPHLRRFSYYFNPDGSIRTMDVLFYDLINTSLPLQTKTGFLPYRITMNAENEVVDFRYIDSVSEKQFSYRSHRMDFFGGWIPIFGQWQWLTDLISRGKLSDGLKFINYVIGDYPMELTKTSDSTIVFVSDLTTAPITLILDDESKINKVDALGSPWNYTVVRCQQTIDVEDFASDFAKKPVLGDPSPHEEFELDLATGKIAIDYGRPSKRGRIVFGNVVPYNEVWRTGAGAPTTITTNKDLIFDGVKIPASKYNIFTVPTKDHWTLIFNTEKETWGSAYDSEYDFAKVRMEVNASNDTYEKFTIVIIPSKKGGILKMMWDKTIASVQFMVNE